MQSREPETRGKSSKECDLQGAWTDPRSSSPCVCRFLGTGTSVVVAGPMMALTLG